MANFKFDYFLSVFPKLLQYLPITCQVALLAFLFSLILGLIIALMLQYKIPVLYQIANVYVSFFRATPFIAQLFLFYYGFAQFSKFISNMSAFTALVVVLTLNYASFMSQDIRAAINSVDKGQFEAGLSIGMRSLDVLKRIVIPQAARVAVPGLSNSFINIFKSTSMGFVIGLKDMMAGASIEISVTYRYMEAYAAAVIIYWALISIFTYIQSILEKKLNRAY
ncbi:amino acid ABC transporter permease [uncultured Brachyspira sp.]|uniref:amino acid ABC transporter permease n=1 Tax=uncultured Brachyspira sp. TaxID=221953 RepID=UPI002607BE79|nr:amino acid ABC transporter permease [uncultured Brachyspira sp.]